MARWASGKTLMWTVPVEVRRLLMALQMPFRFLM
jgi:hypothetical protein